FTRSGEEKSGDRGARTADQRKADEDSTPDAHVRARRTSVPERPERAVRGGRIAAARQGDRAAASKTRADSATKRRQSNPGQGPGGELTRTARAIQIDRCAGPPPAGHWNPAVLQRFPEVRTRGPSLWIHQGSVKEHTHDQSDR